MRYKDVVQTFVSTKQMDEVLQIQRDILMISIQKSGKHNLYKTGYKLNHKITFRRTNQ